MAIFYMNGEFKDESEATIDVNDLIVLRGYGVFDFLRTYNAKPFHLDEHIDRLFNSASLIGIKHSWDKRKVRDVVYETLGRNDFAESNIRIVLSGGDSADSITPAGGSKLMVMVTNLHKLPLEWYTDGVKIITSPVERFMPGSKSTLYLPAIMVLKDAREKGAVESIYCDEKDRLLEGTTTNLFVFKQGNLVTPGIDILPGITRKVVLELMKDRVNVEIRHLHKDEITLVDEAFLTASNKEVTPVVQIDDIQLGDGKVGPKVKEVMDVFREYTQQYSRS